MIAEQRARLGLQMNGNHAHVEWNRSIGASLVGEHAVAGHER